MKNEKLSKVFTRECPDCAYSYQCQDTFVELDSTGPCSLGSRFIHLPGSDFQVIADWLTLQYIMYCISVPSVNISDPFLRQACEAANMDDFCPMPALKPLSCVCDHENGKNKMISSRECPGKVVKF